LAGKVWYIGIKNYPFHTIILSFSVCLVLFALFGGQKLICQYIGNIIWGVASAIVLIDFFKVAIAGHDASSETKLELASKIAILGPTCILLKFIGGILFHDGKFFIHPFLFTFIMFLVVVGVTLRINAAVKSFIFRLSDARKNISPYVAARIYSNQIAKIVAGSSKLTLYLYSFYSFVIFLKDEPLHRALAFSKLIFFILTYRWGILSAQQIKRKQRDHLLAIITVLFLARIMCISRMEDSFIGIASYLNFDSMILLGISFSFIYQNRPFRILPSLLFFFFFTALQFFPHYYSYISKTLAQTNVDYIAIGILFVNLLMTIGIFVFLLISSYSRISLSNNEVIIEEFDMPKNDKDVSTKALFAFGLAVIMISVLSLLLWRADDIPALNFWLSLIAFLIILGFMIPFLLIYLDIIDKKTWLNSFSLIVNKIPVLKIRKEHNEKDSEQDKRKSKRGKKSSKKKPKKTNG